MKTEGAATALLCTIVQKQCTGAGQCLAVLFLCDEMLD